MRWENGFKKRRRLSQLIKVVFAALFLLWTFYLTIFQYLFSMYDSGPSLPKYNISNNPDDIYISQAARRLPLNGTFTWVMSAPVYHKTRVPAINITWLNRLNHGVIFTSEKISDERIPFRTVFYNFDDSYEFLFHKSRFAFYYAYTEISDKFDWYVKTDDDTYLVAENLEKYLKTLDPNKPIYAGFRLKPYLKHGYGSGSLYILSRTAVKIFVDSLYNDTQKCPFDRTEDVGMGRCLANAEIYPIKGRDEQDRGRFHIFDALNTYKANDTAENFEFYYKDNHKEGFEEFSPDLISLHHMSPEAMLTAELFLYRVRKN